MTNLTGLDLLNDPRPILTPDEAATILRVSPKSLALWRSRGDGPAYVRLGRNAVRYRRVDIQAYIEARVAISTAQEHMRRRH